MTHWIFLKNYTQICMRPYIYAHIHTYVFFNKVTKLALSHPLNTTRVKWWRCLWTCPSLQNKPQYYCTYRVFQSWSGSERRWPVWVASYFKNRTKCQKSRLDSFQKTFDWYLKRQILTKTLFRKFWGRQNIWHLQQAFWQHNKKIVPKCFSPQEKNGVRNFALTCSGNL